MRTLWCFVLPCVSVVAQPYTDENVYMICDILEARTQTVRGAFVNK